MRSSFLAILFGALAAQAQTMPPEFVTLGRIRAHMMETMRRIPNYTCLETIERSVKRGRSKRIQLVDSIRLEVAVVDGAELFSWPGERQFKKRDLMEMAPGGAMGNGNFAIHARSVFSSGAVLFQPRGADTFEGRSVLRYDYTFPQLFSGYQIKVGDASAVVGYHGHVLIDPATYDLVDLAVIADELPAGFPLLRATDEMHYSRLRIGEGDFLLPRDSLMTMVALDGSESRNRVSFSGCRQYTGESTVRFDDPEPTAGAAAGPRIILPGELPAGLLVEATLDADFPLETAATGDMLTFTVRADARRKKAVFVPRTAKIHGRIRGVDRKGISYFTGRLAIEFYEIEYEGQIVPLHASLEEGGSFAMRNAQFSIVRGPGEGGTMIYVRNIPARLPKGLLLQLRTLP